MRDYQRKLKNLLINPKYQIKYIFWISLTGLGLVALNAGLVYHYVSENYAILVDLSPMTDEAKAQLYRELREIIIKLSLISIGFLSVVSFFGLIFSHRTAGPMYHFKRIFNAIKSGDTKARVHLRPKDDFQDVAQGFNEMMDSLTGKK